MDGDHHVGETVFAAEYLSPVSVGLRHAQIAGPLASHLDEAVALSSIDGV